MATGTIASNLQTMQDTLDSSSVKCILASRVFVSTATGAGQVKMPNKYLGDIASNLPATWGTGATAWTDLGAVMRSKVTLEYNKEYQEVRSGLDGVFRLSYVSSKTAQVSFALDNYDYNVLNTLTTANASTPSFSSIANSSGYFGFIGKEDTVNRALLIVGTNKIDSKEHHYYCADAEIRFAWEEDGDATVVRVTAVLRPFVHKAATHGGPAGDQTSSSFYTVSIWNPPAA